VNKVEEHTVSISSGITPKNFTSKPNQKLPKEMSKMMESHIRNQVDGFISGGYSGKIIKSTNTTEIRTSLQGHEGINEPDYVKKYVNKYVNKETQGDEHIMNDNNNSMDTLFNEVKLDMRERESRNRQEISDREKRFEEQLKQYNQDSVARENRYREDVKDRDEKLSALVSRIEGKVESQQTKMESIQTQNFWGNIALFVGMLAIVITLIVVVLV